MYGSELDIETCTKGICTLKTMSQLQISTLVCIDFTERDDTNEIGDHTI